MSFFLAEPSLLAAVSRWHEEYLSECENVVGRDGKVLAATCKSCFRKSWKSSSLIVEIAISCSILLLSQTYYRTHIFWEKICHFARYLAGENRERSYVVAWTILKPQRWWRGVGRPYFIERVGVDPFVDPRTFWRCEVVSVVPLVVQEGAFQKAKTPCSSRPN